MMPRKLYVEAGQRLGRGVVIDPEIRLPIMKRGVPVECRGARLHCDCGREYTASLWNLLKPGGQGTVSCGCWRRERASVRAASGETGRTHGYGKHLLYDTWRRMLDRCENPQHPAFHNYGGRGIRVCARWHDVGPFIEDIERLIGPRPEGMTLDRADNDGNYEPGNVRWATKSEQTRNQRHKVKAR